MADRAKVHITQIRDLSFKTKQEMDLENASNSTVRQLTLLRIYHQNKIKEIDAELELMLKDDLGNIEY